MGRRGKMPKKGGKGADKKDAKKEGPDITLQVRKVKQIIAQVMAGPQVLFPQSFTLF